MGFIAFIYAVGLWGTFGYLLINHWGACVGMGGCLLMAGIDFVYGALWPLYWLHII